MQSLRKILVCILLACKYQKSFFLKENDSFNTCLFFCPSNIFITIWPLEPVIMAIQSAFYACFSGVIRKLMWTLSYGKCARKLSVRQKSARVRKKVLFLWKRVGENTYFSFSQMHELTYSCQKFTTFNQNIHFLNINANTFLQSWQNIEIGHLLISDK